MTDAIRNLIQTHQERTIIKQAPDLVVYINGLPYFINDWIGDSGEVVNFNDFVVSASGAADTSTFIPGCTVNLTVPNHAKHLFTGPGGNSPLQTMDEVKVFTKGYYLTKKGETVYHRVFWGVVDTITLAESDTSLEITLGCKGILHLHDLMQINLNPAASTTGAGNSFFANGFVDNQAAYSPLQIIAATFTTPLSLDLVDTDNAINPSQRYGDGLGAITQYTNEWRHHLVNMTKGVRLFGLKSNLSDYAANTFGRPATSTDAAATQARAGEAHTATNVQTDAAALLNFDNDQIASFLPSFQIGQISLFQSAITSRLARVKEMVDLMGWEGYQDLDGSIIIKPPLYNLDPTNTNTPEGSDWNRNPFIIHQDEKKGTDSVVEDSNQIRLTKAAVKGLLVSTPILNEDGTLTPTGVAVDPLLIQRFGLRQEPPKRVSLLNVHTFYLYAYAAAELTRTNKRWRSYSVTIPMRPELRLGFPIYIPHRDIMAYLENISWTYTQGSGSPTMTLSCSMVRNRELMAAPKTTNVGGVTTTTMNWVPVKNAVLRWTQPVSRPVASQPTDPRGQALASEQVKSMRLTANQKRMLNQTQAKGLVVGDPSAQTDDSSYAWRIMDDTGLTDADPFTDTLLKTIGQPSYKIDDVKKRLLEDYGGSFFSKPRKVDPYYCTVVQNYAQPYTDGKGYVLARPFPWGRYTTLEDALNTFTRVKTASGAPSTGGVLPYEGSNPLTNTPGVDSFLKAKTDAFLLTGIGTPTATTSSLTKLADLMTVMSDDITYFTVTYPSTSDPQASGLPQNPLNAFNSATAARSQELAAEAYAKAHPEVVQSYQFSEEYAEAMVTGKLPGGKK